MHCDLFLNLDKEEQDVFITKLNHVVKSNDIMFLAAKRMIKTAENNGILEDVKIGTEEVYNNHG